MLNIILIYFFVFCFGAVKCLFDPFTIGAVASGVYYYYYNMDKINEKTICRFIECCNNENIPANISELSSRLKDNLFGQHIVQKEIISALKAHYNNENQSRKPLVISFHGPPGTGKNFVANHIAESVYKRGLKSKFVHRFMGRADFPVDEDVVHYKGLIKNKVLSALKDCPRSMFIFDEVDKMPSGLFSSLASLLDYNTNVYGSDNTQAVFIFLSNTAGVYISDRLGEIIKGGTLRENVKLSNFESILEKASYNLDGGMKDSSLIESHVIDHFIPFLPLEKYHVYQCIQVEFEQRGKQIDNTLINQIIDEVITYDRTHGIFATSGCKKIHKKVDIYS